jgi:peptide deformylase
MRLKGVKRGLQKTATEILDIGNIFGAEQNESLTFRLPPSRVAFNRELLREVQQMKEAAARHHMLYVTANQVESLNRIFIVNRLHSLTTLTHPNYSNPTDYQAFINPNIVATKG